MKKSTTSKRGRPATGKNPAVLVVMPPELLGAVDEWRLKLAEEFEEPKGRPAAIRALIARGLGKKSTTR